MKSLTPKKPSKDQREKLILFGLIDLYLKTGKPIGSNTLRESGFETLSSATIRNYFTKLEEAGFLLQHHSSGGRIPSPLAFKTYAQEYLSFPLISLQEKKEIQKLLLKETREVVSYLHQATKTISELTGCAAFLSSPRFDQDFILHIKLLFIDETRLLCVMVTDFGMVHSELLHIDSQFPSSLIKKLEGYFNFRLTGIDKPKISQEEEEIASELYKELLLRHIVSYTNFSTEDLCQAGFSKLLAYPDFNEAATLAGGLSLFENQAMLRELLQTTCKQQKLCCWIHNDLAAFSNEAAQCSILTVPYRIHQTVCGAIGILGPNRIPYRELFGKLEEIAENISLSLTKSLYKFKITYRSPTPAQAQLNKKEPALAVLFLNHQGV